MHLKGLHVGCWVRSRNQHEHSEAGTPSPLILFPTFLRARGNAGMIILFQFFQRAWSWDTILERWPHHTLFEVCVLFAMCICLHNDSTLSYTLPTGTSYRANGSTTTLLSIRLGPKFCQQVAQNRDGLCSSRESPTTDKSAGTLEHAWHKFKWLGDAWSVKGYCSSLSDECNRLRGSQPSEWGHLGSVSTNRICSTTKKCSQFPWCSSQ